MTSMKSFVVKVAALSLMAMSVSVFAEDAAPATPAAAAPVTGKALDQLLETIKNSDLRDDSENKAREARFAADRAGQQKLLSEAEAEKNALEARASALAKQFEANDKQIADLTQIRDAKAGNLGELFGVLRQTAGDFATVARNSMLSVELKGRTAEIDRLAQTKTMPPMEDLQRFWYDMAQEMAEGGKIKHFTATVVAQSGEKSQQSVLRIGPFVAISNGVFLDHATGADFFSVPAQQPPSHFRRIGKSFEEETDGYHKMVIDPTRGVLLSLYSQRPSFIDRIELGGWVGYVILLVGFAGAILGIYQFVFLTQLGSKINQQLQNLGRLTDDNPLGRVLLSFKGSNAITAGDDAEVVELRISEAVLRELPPVQRIQPFLKLAVAAGPLLGLVGTVIGMIETFQVITESGSGDPKLMAAGIGHAMIATVLGLAIAIPLLFMNSALSSRSKKIVQILDEQSTGLLAEILEQRRA
jgi:biopolymer transport protein ExbB